MGGVEATKGCPSAYTAMESSRRLVKWWCRCTGRRENHAPEAARVQMDRGASRKLAALPLSRARTVGGRAAGRQVLPSRCVEGAFYALVSDKWARASAVSPVARFCRVALGGHPSPAISSASARRTDCWCAASRAGTHWRDRAVAAYSRPMRGQEGSPAERLTFSSRRCWNYCPCTLVYASIPTCPIRSSIRGWTTTSRVAHQPGGAGSLGYTHEAAPAWDLPEGRNRRTGRQVTQTDHCRSGGCAS